MTAVLRGGEIIFGDGAVRAVPSIVRRLGSRVLICTDPFLASTEAFLRTVAGLGAAGIEVALYDQGIPEVPFQQVVDAGNLAREFGADCIVGFGGGSSIDLAKAAALVARYGFELERFSGEENVPGPIPPVVAVPTTAGTGSEVTPVAVVNDSTRLLKVGVSSRWLVPAFAVVDPELTHSCPSTLTAHAGIDAFAHAVESFLAREDRYSPDEVLAVVFVGKNELTDPLALQAISLIHANLPVVMDEPGDRDARRAMALGSLNAGRAFGSAGTAAAHALQYPVGAMTKTPHGLGVGTLLPYVVAHQFESRIPQLASMAAAMGLVEDPRTPPEEAASRAVDGVGRLCDRVGIPRTIDDLGVTQGQIPGLASDAAAIGRLVSNSAVDLDAQELERILNASYRGDRTIVYREAPAP
jgi:alcohol dehydrogenase class IV